jgi:hypothetical protein
METSFWIHWKRSTAMTGRVFLPTDLAGVHYWTGSDFILLRHRAEQTSPLLTF